MYQISDATLDAYKSPARELYGWIYYTSSTTGEGVYIKPEDKLVSFTIDKTSPTGKFFGFAVSQKITVEVLGAVEGMTEGTSIIPVIQPKGQSPTPMPNFYVDSILYNRAKNKTTIVGYDFIHKLDRENIGQFEFTYPIYAQNYALDFVEPLGGYVEFAGINHLIKEAPNVSPSATCREVLIALAEFTGCICYVSYGNNIRFRRMGSSSNFTDVLTPDDYFDLTVGQDIVQLSMIGCVNEFGGNSHIYGTTGFAHIMRENPFMYRDDAGEILDTIGPYVVYLYNRQYNLKWRGCPAYEMGDLIILQDIDGNANYVRFLNETLVFDGGLSSTSDWEPTESDSFDIRPNNISSTIKNTSATVDKINSEISLVVETMNTYDEKFTEYDNTIKTYDSRISEIEVNTEGIELIVQSNQETITRVDGLEYEVEELSKEVGLAVTEDEVSIMLAQEVANNGVTSVKTTTGYTFDRDGLRINKSTSTLETVITENGMTVTDAGEVRLIADADGVTANKFTADTYLSIQGNIIFAEYGNDRMGCFWTKEE